MPGLKTLNRTLKWGKAMEKWQKYLTKPMGIKTVRLELRLTQEELAHRLGVNKGMVSKWERGKSKPSISVQTAIEELKREVFSGKVAERAGTR